MTQINVGRVRTLYKGAWNVETSYDFYDWVTHEGCSYVCINADGAPAGTAVTNETYWACQASNANVVFATEEETAAGTETSKAISPSTLKNELDGVNELIDALEARADALETQTSTGQVADADTLDGQHGDYYRCANGCSWTCSSECSGGCGNGCTGSCLAGCTGGCSSCTGTCAGSCSGSCTGTCLNTCTSCSGCTSCTGCGTNCSTNCSSSCGNRS